MQRALCAAGLSDDMRGDHTEDVAALLATGNGTAHSTTVPDVDGREVRAQTIGDVRQALARVHPSLPELSVTVKLCSVIEALSKHLPPEEPLVS